MSSSLLQNQGKGNPALIARLTIALCLFHNLTDPLVNLQADSHTVRNSCSLLLDAVSSFNKIKMLILPVLLQSSNWRVAVLQVGICLYGSNEPSHHSPVAGLSCRVLAQAASCQQYWQILLESDDGS